MQMSRQMNMIFATVLVCLGVAACGPKPMPPILVEGERGQTETSELVVAEVVVRHLLANVPPGEDVLVSFGKSWDDPVDPPGGFLERLGDIPAQFKAASAYQERENYTPLLLVVHVNRFVGETVAEVTAVRYRQGIGASDGFTATVTWAGGHWRVSEKRKSWSS